MIEKRVIDDAINKLEVALNALKDLRRGLPREKETVQPALFEPRQVNEVVRVRVKLREPDPNKLPWDD